MEPSEPVDLVDPRGNLGRIGRTNANESLSAVTSVLGPWFHQAVRRFSMREPLGVLVVCLIAIVGCDDEGGGGGSTVVSGSVAESCGSGDTQSCSGVVAGTAAGEGETMMLAWAGEDEANVFTVKAGDFDSGAAGEPITVASQRRGSLVIDGVALALNGDEGLVAWTEPGGERSNTPVRSRVIATGLAEPIDPINELALPVPRGAAITHADNLDLAASPTGDGYLLVGSVRYRPSGGGQRASAFALPVDQRGESQDGGLLLDGQTTRISATRSGYLALVGRCPGLRVVRFLRDGSPTPGSTTLAKSGCAASGDIASDPNGVAIASWLEADAGGERSVRSRYLDSRGRPRGAIVSIATDPASRGPVRVTTAGDGGFLVVFAVRPDAFSEADAGFQGLPVSARSSGAEPFWIERLDPLRRVALADAARSSEETVVLWREAGGAPFELNATPVPEP